MLNTAIVMGRLTAEPELKNTGGGIAVCSFTLAVDRRYKAPGEERQADFIRCVAWRERAEFLSKFFHKGSMVAVVGSIQVRSYEDKNGQKREAVELVCDQVNFTGERNAAAPVRDDIPLPTPPAEGRAGAQPAPGYSTAAPADFAEIADDDDLPF